MNRSEASSAPEGPVVVVLAAGRGTRLRPATDARPKVMLEVGGRPILGRCLDQLALLEPARYVLVVGHHAEQIERRFGDRFAGRPIVYVEQPRPTGSAAALLLGEPHVDGAFVVMNGDNVYEADLRPALARHRHRAPDATLVVERLAPDRLKQGLCVTDDDGRVERLIERPAPDERRDGGLTVAGCYVFSPTIFDACRAVAPSDRGEYELSDAINLLIKGGGRVETEPLDGWRLNVNTLEDLERAERRARQG